MESVSTLKRPWSDSLSLCIICQEHTKTTLRSGSTEGIQKLQECANERHKLKDIKQKDVIERVLNMSPSSESLVWHKGCYSAFTDKNKISRLRSSVHVTVPHSSTASSSDTGHSMLRSSKVPVNWNLCLFCHACRKEPLHLVTSFNMSDRIIEASKFDQSLSIALSDCSDLISAEGKYHLTCYIQYMRNTTKTQVNSEITDISMAWLCEELEQSAEKGHILDTKDVWSRYCELCEKSHEDIPPSFLSRQSTFKSKLITLIGDTYEFHVLDRDSECEKRTVMVPKQFSHIPIVNIIDSSQDNTSENIFPVFKPQDDVFLSLVHVALKLRSDILNHTPYTGANVSVENTVSCIPDTLYMFLKIMYGGEDVFEGVGDSEIQEEDDMDTDVSNNTMTDRVLSVAQDLIYGTSGGNIWTPKHVGLGCSLHQATRTKELVQLFHKAGHVISYKNILQLDTAMAEATLSSMDQSTGAILPRNLVEGIFMHFTADNIDILDSSLDGKDTFHATQLAAWQRGPPGESSTLNNIRPSRQTTLEEPEALNRIIPPIKKEGKTEPVFQHEVKPEWFCKESDTNEAENAADAKEMAFIIRRNAEPLKCGWSQYNQEHSDIDQPQTTIGYMPLILAPAHELYTLNTVIQRCKYIAEANGQKYVVLTVDEALYCKLMTLKWLNESYQEFLIPRLGGFHTTMNFMKSIGQHMQSTGLMEVWVDSNLLGQKTAENVMAGKGYEKSVRAHKITAQALWEIVLPQFLEYLQIEGTDLKHDIEEAEKSPNDDCLTNILSTKRFRNALSEFGESHATDSNFMLWWEYLNMVRVLLMFIRAQRDGLWDLHLTAFSNMLPYFHRYDHTNYAKWGVIYLAEMKQLPEEIAEQFQLGNFVVKLGKARFNQVDPDQAQEWLNGTGKRSGGIVGITKNISALWSLSFSMRTEISLKTRELYGLKLDDSLTHKEASKSRRQKDLESEKSVVRVLRRFGVFAEDSMTRETLENIATKDQATEEITKLNIWDRNKLKSLFTTGLLPLQKEHQNHFQIH